MEDAITWEQVDACFSLAANEEEGDAILQKPGSAGLQILLETYFPDYEIKEDHIKETSQLIAYTEDMLFTLSLVRKFELTFFVMEEEAAEVEKEHLSALDLNVLIKESNFPRHMQHRMPGNSFISFIPPNLIDDNILRQEAAYLTACVSAEVIPVLDEEIWSAWSVIQEMLEVLDDEDDDDEYDAYEYDSEPYDSSEYYLFFCISLFFFFFFFLLFVCTSPA